MQVDSKSLLVSDSSSIVPADPGVGTVPISRQQASRIEQLLRQAALSQSPKSPHAGSSIPALLSGTISDVGDSKLPALSAKDQRRLELASPAASPNVSSDLFDLRSMLNELNCSSSSDGSTGSSLIDDEYTRNIYWQLRDFSLLVGSDLTIFGTPTHPLISLRVNSKNEPVSVLSGMEAWLENIINSVPEVAMFYHHEDIVSQHYELYKTEDLPEVCGFSAEQAYDSLIKTVDFLKQNASQEGHTYWLVKEPELGITKLYDLTRLCDNVDEESPVTSSSDYNPYAFRVACLCYRLAEEIWLLRVPNAAQPNSNADALQSVFNAIRLLCTCLNLASLLEYKLARVQPSEQSPNDLLMRGLGDLKNRATFLLCRIHLTVSHRQMVSFVQQVHQLSREAVDCTTLELDNLVDRQQKQRKSGRFLPLPLPPPLSDDNLHERLSPPTDKRMLGDVVLFALTSPNDQRYKLLASAIDAYSCKSIISGPLASSSSSSNEYDHRLNLSIRIVGLQSCLDKAVDLWVNRNLDKHDPNMFQIFQRSYACLVLIETLVRDNYTMSVGDETVICFASPAGTGHHCSPKVADRSCRDRLQQSTLLTLLAKSGSLAAVSFYHYYTHFVDDPPPPTPVDLPDDLHHLATSFSCCPAYNQDSILFRLFNLTTLAPKLVRILILEEIEIFLAERLPEFESIESAASLICALSCQLVNCMLRLTAGCAKSFNLRPHQLSKQASRGGSSTKLSRLIAVQQHLEPFASRCQIGLDDLLLACNLFANAHRFAAICNRGRETDVIRRFWLFGFNIFSNQMVTNSTVSLKTRVVHYLSEHIFYSIASFHKPTRPGNYLDHVGVGSSFTQPPDPYLSDASPSLLPIDLFAMPNKLVLDDALLYNCATMLRALYAISRLVTHPKVDQVFSSGQCDALRDNFLAYVMLWCDLRCRHLTILPLRFRTQTHTLIHRLLDILLLKSNLDWFLARGRYRRNLFTLFNEHAKSYVEEGQPHIMALSLPKAEIRQTIDQTRRLLVGHLQFAWHLEKPADVLFRPQLVEFGWLNAVEDAGQSTIDEAESFLCTASHLLLARLSCCSVYSASDQWSLVEDFTIIKSPLKYCLQKAAFDCEQAVTSRSTPGIIPSPVDSPTLSSDDCQSPAIRDSKAVATASGESSSSQHPWLLQSLFFTGLKACLALVKLGHPDNRRGSRRGAGQRIDQQRLGRLGQLLQVEKRSLGEIDSLFANRLTAYNSLVSHRERAETLLELVNKLSILVLTTDKHS